MRTITCVVEQLKRNFKAFTERTLAKNKVRFISTREADNKNPEQYKTDLERVRNQRHLAIRIMVAQSVQANNSFQE